MNLHELKSVYQKFIKNSSKTHKRKIHSFSFYQKKIWIVFLLPILNSFFFFAWDEKCKNKQTSAQVTKGCLILRSQFFLSIALSCLLEFLISFSFSFFSIILLKPFLIQRVYYTENWAKPSSIISLFFREEGGVGWGGGVVGVCGKRWQRKKNQSKDICEFVPHCVT